MASGNCSNMKREMEGKMTSAVNGFEEVVAATAKELKATRTMGKKRQRLTLLGLLNK
jgi:hypothetical protein